MSAARRTPTQERARNFQFTPPSAAAGPARRRGKGEPFSSSSPSAPARTSSTLDHAARRCSRLPRGRGRCLCSSPSRSSLLVLLPRRHGADPPPACTPQPDQIKVILLLVGSVPLSLAYPYFPPSTRSPIAHLYSLVPSVVFLCFCLDLRWGFFQLLASSLATWVVCKVGVAQKWGAAMPWLVFTVVMGHLAVKCVSPSCSSRRIESAKLTLPSAHSHVLRHLDDTPLTTIEVTGSQMVLCMKLISFAWSVYDGTRPLEQLDTTQKASRIEGVPGLLPFLGYAWAPSTPSSSSLSSSLTP